jgi:hypothetical protein
MVNFSTLTSLLRVTMNLRMKIIGLCCRRIFESYIDFQYLWPISRAIFSTPVSDFLFAISEEGVCKNGWYSKFLQKNQGTEAG